MKIKEHFAWRNLLAGVLALAFLSVGSVLAAPEHALAADLTLRTSQPAGAVELSGCDFVYAGADIPLTVQIADNRVVSLTGELRCTGTSETAIPVRVSKTDGEWQGNELWLRVTAPAGQEVACVLTNLLVTLDIGTVPFPDLIYSAPVRTCNISSNYLTVAGPSSPQPGEIIPVAVSGRGAGLSGKVQTQGLEVLGVSSDFASTDGFVLLPDYNVRDVYYTCRVTAASGQKVSFQLTNVSLWVDSMVVFPQDAGWETTVATGAPTVRPTMTAAPTAKPTVTAAPTAKPTVTATPTARPTATPAPTASPMNPGAVPAPEIPAVSGYQSGRINGKNYYVKTAGSSTLFYLQSSSGRMARVSAPYITATGGIRYYPVQFGGTALFPRLQDGRIVCYSIFADGMEIPVLNVQSTAVPDIIEGYQRGTINGKQYYVKTSGASTLFYLKSSSGRMARVSVPYITGADGIRYYPINFGGTVLFPKIVNGRVTSYVTSRSDGVLVLE